MLSGQGRRGKSYIAHVGWQVAELVDALGGLPDHLQPHRLRARCTGFTIDGGLRHALDELEVRGVTAACSRDWREHTDGWPNTEAIFLIELT